MAVTPSRHVEQVPAGFGGMGGKGREGERRGGGERGHYFSDHRSCACRARHVRDALKSFRNSSVTPCSSRGASIDAPSASGERRRLVDAPDQAREALREPTPLLLRQKAPDLAPAAV